MNTDRGGKDKAMANPVSLAAFFATYIFGLPFLFIIDYEVRFKSIRKL